MPISVCANGEVLDVQYKRLGNGMQTVYVGTTYIGQVAEVYGWTAISRDPYPFMPVHGFKTKADAVEFLLNLSEFRSKR